MKKQMKFIALIAAVVCAMTSTTNILCVTTEKTPKASKGEKWNFEVFNKTGGQIEIRVYDLNSLNPFSIFEEKLKDKEKVRAVLNTQKPLAIKIWTNNKPNPFGSNPNIYKGLTTKTDAGTIFLTVDEKGVRPQTGPFLGLLNKTDSGLDNSKNISPLGIQNVK